MAGRHGFVVTCLRALLPVSPGKLKVNLNRNGENEAPEEWGSMFWCWVYQVRVSPSLTASDRGLDVKLSVVNLNICFVIRVTILSIRAASQNNTKHNIGRCRASETEERGNTTWDSSHDPQIHSEISTKMDHWKINKFISWLTLFNFREKGRKVCSRKYNKVFYLSKQSSPTHWIHQIKFKLPDLNHNEMYSLHKPIVEKKQQNFSLLLTNGYPKESW